MSAPNDNWQSPPIRPGLAADLTQEAAREEVADPRGIYRLINKLNPYAVLRHATGSEVDDSAPADHLSELIDWDDDKSLPESLTRRKPSWASQDVSDADPEETPEEADLYRTRWEGVTRKKGTQPAGQPTQDLPDRDQVEIPAVDDAEMPEAPAVTQGNTAAFEAWKAQGKPLCSTCQRKHPPPCDLEKAKKAFALEHLKETLPEEYAKLQAKQKADQRRKSKLRKRAATQSAQASSTQTQQGRPQQDQTITQRSPAQNNGQQTNNSVAGGGSQPSTNNPSQPAQTQSGAQPAGHSAKDRGVAFCKNCECSHPWGKHTKLKPQQAPKNNAATFPTLPGQIEAPAKVSVPPKGSTAAPHRGGPMAPRDVMKHLIANVTTKEGLDFVIQIANSGSGLARIPASVAQPTSYAQSAASTAGSGSTNVPKDQQPPKTKNGPRGGANTTPGSGPGQKAQNTSSATTGSANAPSSGLDSQMTDAGTSTVNGQADTSANATAAAAAAAKLRKMAASATAAPAASGTPKSATGNGKQPQGP